MLNTVPVGRYLRPLATHVSLALLFSRAILKHVRWGRHVGRSQVMKLVNNLISSATMVATAEGIVLGVQAGLDPATMLGLLNASTGRSRRAG